MPFAYMATNEHYIVWFLSSCGPDCIFLHDVNVSTFILRPSKNLVCSNTSVIRRDVSRQNPNLALLQSGDALFFYFFLYFVFARPFETCRRTIFVMIYDDM